MREIIIQCDHCGNVIDGDPYKVCLEQVDRESGELRMGQPEAFEKVAEMDWCANCFHNLTAFLLDTSHLLLATPCQREAPASCDQEDDAEETPVETSSGGGRRKRRLIWEN